ncbi:sigma-70 family RNA polymerase sigma factor [Cohnella sp. GCM10012308]|uniref:sigma-70 family RNA polymerase sigma factor n=1 Tax=Cohnella sp. GCM10012308 TaxID=3317329 RepID=UPI00360B416D
MNIINAIKAEDHMGLVGIVAKQFVRRASTSFDFEDIVSAGYMGLVEAAARFEPERGLAFSTYAVTLIRGSILRNLRAFGGPIVKTPRPTRELAQKLLWSKLTDLSDEAAASFLGTTVEKVRRARDLHELTVRSLDAPLSDSDHKSFSSKIPRSADFSSHIVNDFLSRLPERTADVLHWRMAGLTQNEIARKIGTSQVQVCRIIRRVGKVWLEYAQ